MATIKVDRGARSEAFPRRRVSYVAAPKTLASGAAGAMDAPEAQTASPSPWPTAALGLVAIVTIVIVAYLADKIWGDDMFDKAVAVAAVPGVTVFAVFFVTAQALERLLEPLSAVLLTKDGLTDGYAKALDAVEAKLADWAAAIGDASKAASTKTAAETAMKAAADAKAKLDGRQQNRTVLFWAIATVFGIAASAALRLYLLKTVGIKADLRLVEVLATGLVIGAGTKPLHDLVTTISEKKDQVASATSATAV
jgi:hypothetical protein